METKLKCKVIECTLTARIKGNCKAHYHQMWKFGRIVTPTIAVRPRRVKKYLNEGNCIEKDCKFKARRTGRCDRHFRLAYPNRKGGYIPIRAGKDVEV